MQIVTSWMEEGIEIGLDRGRGEGLDRGRQEGLDRGRQEGRGEGKLELLLAQLTRRFNELESDVEVRIFKLNLTQLDVLGLEMLDFESVADLITGLAKVEENFEDEDSDRTDEEE